MTTQFYLRLSFWRSKHLPVLIQTEVAECGLASLCMIANYWGHQIDIASMRRRFTVSMKGATLKGLMSMAYSLQMQPRPLKLEMNGLHSMKLPCVLHWNLNHFVVLKSLTQTHAVIHDPAVGVRRLALIDVAKHFTGIALELSPETEFKRLAEVRSYSLRSLMGRIVGLKRGLSQIIVLGLVLQVFALASPFYLQWIIDEALISADRDLITILGMGFLLLVVLQTIVAAVRSWVTTVLSTNLNFQWLSNAFGHLMRLPLPYFEKRHTGDIVSRFSSIQTIQRSLTTQFVEGAIDGLLVIGTLFLMSIYSVSLASIACGTVLIYAIVRVLIFRSLSEATAEQIIHSARQQSHFMASVRGIQSVRLFHRVEERRSGWLNTLATQFNAEIRIAKLSVSYQTANTFLFGVERIIIIWLAALAVLDAKFSVGMLFAFLSYKEQFSQRMASLVDKIFDLRMLKLHGERVADILMSEPERDQSPEVSPDDIAPTIEFRNVSFQYSDSEQFVIQNFDLVIGIGECIAVTGASGSGKTTLIKLLLGLLEPTKGLILIGGAKMEDLGMSNFRHILGTVMQEDTLFGGSIADNICFFDPMPSQQRIEECAALAAIHQEIVAMPMGYHTLVGDIGSGLSGGQKQRILLARALYKKPKILVLDEATSHLDIKNEQAVNQAISNIPLTRVIVAHRSETIAMAERVIEMQNGKIVRDFLQRTSQAESVPLCS